MDKLLTNRNLVLSHSGLKIRKNLCLVWLLMMVLLINTSEVYAMSGKAKKFPVQGSHFYGMRFIRPPLLKNWDYGNYTYAPFEGELIVSGGRCCYDVYYTLDMSFGYKDGRQYHEIIDIEALMMELASKEGIFDNRKTKEGGGAYIEVKFSDDELMIDYVVYERHYTENPPGLSRDDYRYPLYRKALK